MHTTFFEYEKFMVDNEVTSFVECKVKMEMFISWKFRNSSAKMIMTTVDGQSQI